MKKEEVDKYEEYLLNFYNCVEFLRNLLGNEYIKLMGVKQIEAIIPFSSGMKIVNNDHEKLARIAVASFNLIDQLEQPLSQQADVEKLTCFKALQKELLEALARIGRLRCFRNLHIKSNRRVLDITWHCHD